MVDVDVSTPKGAKNQEKPQKPTPNGQAGPAETPVDIARQTMVGDVSAWLFELVGEIRDPWHKLPKKQQEYWRRRSHDRICAIVDQAVGILAAERFPAISVALEQITLKPKGIETKLTMSSLDRLSKRALVEAHGRVIRLVITDSAAFSGARPRPDAEAETKAGEPELPLGEKIAELAAEGEKLGEELFGGSESRRVGREDGRQGVRDHAARWSAGEIGHGDYELGHEEGRQERAAAIEKAQAEGAEVGKAGGDRAVNPYEPGSKEHEAWLTGWIAPEPGNNGGHVPPAAKPQRKRGRRPNGGAVP